MTKPKKSVIVLIAASVGLAAIVAGGMQFIASARDADFRLQCGINLKQLSSAFATYSESRWDGITPPIDFLRALDILHRRQFVCLASGKENYVIVTWRQGEPLGNRAIVAYEPSSNHLGKGGFVVFADGHASFVRSPQLEQMIASIPKQQPH